MKSADPHFRPCEHTSNESCLRNLGLDPATWTLGPAGCAEARRAYRGIARRKHPDKHPDLSDAEKRRLEDELKNQSTCYEIVIGKQPPPRLHRARTQPPPGDRTERGSHRTTHKPTIMPVPVVDPPVVAFGIVGPTSRPDEVSVAIYARVDDEPVGLPPEREVKLGAYAGKFWTRVDYRIESAPDAPDHYLLTFAWSSAGLEPFPTSGHLSDELVVSFGSNSVAIPIVARYLTVPTISHVMRRRGRTVELDLEILPDDDLEIVIDWGDGDVTVV